LDPLEQLKAIHLPEQIHHWPISIGWWIILIIIVTLITVITKKVIKKRQLFKVQKQALTALNSDQQLSTEQILAQLKWACMHYFNRSDVAAKHGEELLNFFISKLDPQHQLEFRAKAADALIQCYRKSSVDIYAADFQQAALLWIQNAQLVSSNISAKATGKEQGND
jgi:ABC-type transport system involved in Fe-S cluster assembly fused permease/ATPase subunit